MAFFPPYMHADHMASNMFRRFDELFRCYPVTHLPGSDRSEANYGGKIFLPASSLDKLTRLQITYPMLFELNDLKQTRTAHAGVQEFIAEEGRVYLPQWLMASLNLSPGDLIKVKSTDLPLGSFIRLQPQSTDFLQITNPRAVLEKAFRNFTCLTTGDVFTFSYNNNDYAMAVLETKPENDKKAICTMETDLSVEFAPPVGYDEAAEAEAMAKGKAMAGMGGSGGVGGVGAGPSAQGAMARSIGYGDLVGTSDGAAGSATVNTFATPGRRLGAVRSTSSGVKSLSSSMASSSMASSSTMAGSSVAHSTSTARSANGSSQYRPLRLPPGQLFFGYNIVPVKDAGDGEDTKGGGGGGDGDKPDPFQGSGRKLRKQ